MDKYKKIDAHIHLMPSDVIEANKEYGGNFIDFGDVEDRKLSHILTLIKRKKYNLMYQLRIG